MCGYICMKHFFPQFSFALTQNHTYHNYSDMSLKIYIYIYVTHVYSNIRNARCLLKLAKWPQEGLSLKKASPQKPHQLGAFSARSFRIGSKCVSLGGVLQDWLQKPQCCPSAQPHAVPKFLPHALPAASGLAHAFFYAFYAFEASASATWDTHHSYT